jgi:hypothetical protein
MNSRSGPASIPLSIIDGMTPHWIRRLRRAGVTNIVLLALSNPLVLFNLLPTSTLRQIIDWIAQAALYTDFGESVATRLRAQGIKDILAFLHLSNTEQAIVLAEAEVDPSIVPPLVVTLNSDIKVLRLKQLLEVPAVQQMIADAVNDEKQPESVFRVAQSRAYRAYEKMSIKQRLSVANPLVFAGSAAVMIWCTALLGKYGYRGLQSVVDLLIHPAYAAAAKPAGVNALLDMLPADLRNVIICASVLCIMITVLVTLYAAFLAKKRSANAYEFLKQSLTFFTGTFIGSFS